MTEEAKKIIAALTEPLELKIIIKRKYYLLILDQIIRISIIVWYLQANFSAWLVIIYNIILFLIEVYYINQRDTKTINYFNKKITKEYKNAKITIGIETGDANSNLDISFTICGFIFSYWFIYYAHQENNWYYHIYYFIIACLGAFSFLILSLSLYPASPKRTVQAFSVNKKTGDKKEDVTKYFPDIISNFKRETQPETIQLDSVDYNDTQIAKLESELKGINNKVEAYLLESILLGGLSFSGFLTVITSDVFKDRSYNFSTFCKDFSIFFNQTINIRKLSGLEHLYTNLYKIFTQYDLFLLIMFMCLFCSVFFLLVLTLRMRYMALSLELDHLLRIMIVFNAKEEELTNLKWENNANFGMFQQARLNKIVKKIDFAISDANKLRRELNPIVSLMSFCRNMAVMIFYFVLIISGFYFSRFIALIIFFIAILVILIRWIETLTNLNKVKQLLSRHK